MCVSEGGVQRRIGLKKSKEVTCWREICHKCDTIRSISVSDWCPSSSSGLQDVHFSESLRGAAVLHPEEAVLAEWLTLRGPPLPRHRRLALLPGQQDRTCGLEEAPGESLRAVKEFEAVNRFL